MPPIQDDDNESSIVIGSERVIKEPSRVLFLKCFQCFFVSVAVLLSSGILGLPLKLHRSGFLPFLVTFTPNIFFQVLVAYFFIVVLQFCDSALKESLHDENTYNTLNGLSLVETDLGTIRENTAENQNELTRVGLTLPKRVRMNLQTSSKITTNLHVLSKLFLPRWLRYLFAPLFLIEFVSVLTCYGLAGSEAVGQLLNLHYVFMIPAFVILLSLIIIVAYTFIQSIISILTLVKGFIFITVCIIGISVSRGRVDAPTIVNNWRYTADPILFETLALGGLPLCMPMLYEKFGKSKRQIKAFRTTVIAAILFCALVNVLWAWSVMSVVPQSDPTCRDIITTNNVNNTVYGLAPPQAKSRLPLAGATEPSVTAGDGGACDPSNSLEAAQMKGTITTVPFTKMIMETSPDVTFYAILIRLFVALSTAVSFLVIGASLHHTVIGFVNFLMTLRRMKQAAESRPVPTCHLFSSNYFWHILTSSLLFLVVLSIAMARPQSFVALSERLSSIGTNFFAGPAIFVMLQRACLPPYSNLPVPLPPSPRILPLRYPALGFFLLAIVYDVALSLYRLAAAAAA